MTVLDKISELCVKCDCYITFTNSGLHLNPQSVFRKGSEDLVKCINLLNYLNSVDATLEMENNKLVIKGLDE